MYFGRGPNKIQDPYKSRDYYKYYIEDIEENNPYYVTLSEYCQILNDFYKSTSESVIRENIPFKFPYNLGILAVVKKKLSLNHLGINGVDWKTTVNAGKNVYHLNEHTSGYKYFFKWEKRNRVVKNIFMYRLVMTRSNKRLLAKLIKSKKYDFFEV
jgi:hypothetical protein